LKANVWQDSNGGILLTNIENVDTGNYVCPGIGIGQTCSIGI